MEGVGDMYGVLLIYLQKWLFASTTASGPFAGPQGSKFGFQRGKRRRHKVHHRCTILSRLLDFEWTTIGAWHYN